MKNLEQSILGVVNSKGYRPIKPRKIAEQLRLSKDEAVEVRRAIKRLVHLGQLRYASNHLVLPIVPAPPRAGESRTSPRRGGATPTQDPLTVTPSQRASEHRDDARSRKEKRAMAASASWACFSGPKKASVSSGSAMR